MFHFVFFGFLIELTGAFYAEHLFPPNLMLYRNRRRVTARWWGGFFSWLVTFLSTKSCLSFLYASSQIRF
jgi:hypothetical protein